MRKGIGRAAGPVLAGMLVLSAIAPAAGYWVDRVEHVEEGTAGLAAVRIGDVTGDGRVDVVTALETGAPGLYLHAGATGGGFLPRVQLNAGLFKALLLHDFDGDGRLDIIAGTAGGVLFKFADGLGGFRDRSVASGAYRHEVANLAAYDVDLDGRADIVGLAWYGQAHVFYAAPADQVPATRSFVVPTEGYNDMAVGDVDHDGRPDLVLSSGQTAYATHLQVLGPDGQGGLVQRAGYTAGFNGLGGLAVGDFDGDGLDEIMASRTSNSPAFLWRVLLDEQLDLISLEEVPTDDVPVALEAGDFNADGLADLAVFHSGWLNIGHYLQKPGGQGLHAEGRAYMRYVGSWKAEALAVGDLDGDGCGDFALSEVNFPLSLAYGGRCDQQAPSVDLSLRARSYRQSSPDPMVEWPYGNSNHVEIQYKVRRGQVRVPDARIRVTLRLRPGFRSFLVAEHNNIFVDQDVCQKLAEKPSTLVYDCLPYPSSGVGEAEDLWQRIVLVFDLFSPMEADVEIRAVSPSLAEASPGDNVVRLFHRYSDGRAEPVPSQPASVSGGPATPAPATPGTRRHPALRSPFLGQAVSRRLAPPVRSPRGQPGALVRLR